MDTSILITRHNISVTYDKELTLDEDYLHIKFESGGRVKGKYIYQGKEFLVEHTDIDIDTLINLDQFNPAIPVKFPLEFPGSTYTSKIKNYFSLGVGSILVLFDLLQQEPRLLGPLEIVFPNVLIDINILNKKFYHFFKTYITFLENNGDNTNDNLDEYNNNLSNLDLLTGSKAMSSQSSIKHNRPSKPNNMILVKWLTFIDNFWDTFGDLIEPEDSSASAQQMQDMLCIHASTLGYARFLEQRITNTLKSLDLEKDKGLTVIQKHNLTIEKYYNEEILKIAEKLSNLKNVHQDLIDDTKNAIKKTKQDMEAVGTKLHRELLDNIKRDTNTIIESKTVELSEDFGRVSKRNISELERSLNNIENQQIQKLRDIINEMSNKKTMFNRDFTLLKSQTIDDINTIKNETLGDINKMRLGTTKEHEDIKNKIDIYWERVKNFSDIVDSKVQEINDFKSAKMEEYWVDISEALKKQSKIIIQSVLDETLEELGTVLDDQIEQRINKKLNEMSKK